MKKRGRQPKNRAEDLSEENATLDIPSQEKPLTSRFPLQCPVCGGPRISGTVYHRTDCEAMK